jgi:hypothetical protein
MRRHLVALLVAAAALALLVAESWGSGIGG